MAFKYTCDCCGVSLRRNVVHEGNRHWCRPCSMRDDREECARDHDQAEAFEEMAARDE